MRILPLRTNLAPPAGDGLPFAVYTVGTECQQPITRVNGFSAKQLFLAFSGSGLFRMLDRMEWEELPAGSAIYIPDGLPHEYKPRGKEPWFVGYATFVEREPAALRPFGFGDEAVRFELEELDRLYGLLERMWDVTGAAFEAWSSAELFLAFVVELKKQIRSARRPPARPSDSYKTGVVALAEQFMRDHLQRQFTVAELAGHLGYSTKHLIRLFRQVLGTTPLQYLLALRMQTARELLRRNPAVTVRQVAAYVGLKPDYFARLFHRAYGVNPSELKGRRA